MNESLQNIAKQLMADHKGFLAADESVSTATKRLAEINLESTEETRRQYRNLFLTTADLGQYISGVILFEETLTQSADDGTPFMELLRQHQVIPIIKVDKGAHDMALFPGEKVTDGLDKLRDRFAEFYKKGCRAAKWRAVIKIEDNTVPSEPCLHANAHALARYAALAQEAGIVPIVEPEVLIDGPHDIARSEAVTTATLQIMFDELKRYRVDPTATILKSSMVISGNECTSQATPDEIAAATLRCFKKTVPAELPGIVFLSGGQSATQATENLNAIARQSMGPWPLSFSYARALQGTPLQIWNGKPENLAAAQAEFSKRMRLNHAAAKGAYTPDMEHA